MNCFLTPSPCCQANLERTSHRIGIGFMDEILADFPTLSEEQLRAVITYAPPSNAAQACQRLLVELFPG